MQHLRLFLQINDVEIQENNFIYQRNRNISHQNIKTKVKRCEHIHFDLRHKSEYVRGAHVDLTVLSIFQKAQTFDHNLTRALN